MTEAVVRRIAYGAVFVVAIPAGLVVWARGAERVVPLHTVHSRTTGLVLLALGLLLIAAGARALMLHGRGLPMNAFPPPRLVRRGIYRWIRNPMYIGFGLVCAGTSIAAGSAAGLWLVTPVSCLAAAALVYGFERHDLQRRLGPDALEPPLLSFPSGSAERPTAAQRTAVLLWVLVPWLLSWLAVQTLGRAPDAFQSARPFERTLPVLQWTELVYASAYVFVPLTVLVIGTQGALRRFAVQGVIAIIVVTVVWLTVPIVAANRAFHAAGPLGRLLAFEQAHSSGVAAFPAFHVLWAFISADAWTANARATRHRWWSVAGWSWALLIAASSITTGMHTIIEVLAAALLFLPLRRYAGVWRQLIRLTEWLAGSWKEWRVGPVRVINYGAWAAAAAGVGLLVAGMSAGPEHVRAVCFVALCALVGAGLWAQMLEGSSKLLRPFGWYGGVIGGAIGASIARIAGAPLMPILAAFGIAMPWIQLLGRLRCLVQGCCHGRRSTPQAGIRYSHPRSRVGQLAQLSGVPIYPTPLYSIGANIVLGVILVRLRTLGASDALIVGVCLMLGGIARFVEESYRGEPQTPVIAGLHSYQWLAIASVVIGAVCTTIPAAPEAAGFQPPNAALVWTALAIAVVTGIAMGVDFPGSSRRFSRLASADPLAPPRGGRA